MKIDITPVVTMGVFNSSLWIETGGIMEFKDRKREWLLQPQTHGAPLNHTKSYFNHRVEKMRKDHPEFGEYLGEIKRLIIEEKLDHCENIIRFIDGDAETNWLSNKNGMFAVFIKLFNYDLSPVQTVRYIQKCYSFYDFLMRSKYIINDYYELSLERSEWDGRIKRRIRISVEPKEQISFDEHIWFNVSFFEFETNNAGETIMHVSHPNVELSTQCEHHKDTMMMFVYKQSALYKDILLQVVKQLEEKKILINNAGVYELQGELGRNDYGSKKICVVENLINHPSGTLSFHEQRIFAYSPIKGVFVRNNVCYVDSNIKSIDCIFTGKIRRKYLKEDCGCLDQSIYYDTVIFNSKVNIKLSTLVNPFIKKVYFTQDVNEIVEDIDTYNIHLPTFGIPDNKDTNIYKFCKKNNLKYEIVLGVHYTFNPK